MTDALLIWRGRGFLVDRGQAAKVLRIVAEASRRDQGSPGAVFDLLCEDGADLGPAHLLDVHNPEALARLSDLLAQRELFPAGGGSDA